jgi:hypothetical protein
LKQASAWRTGHVTHVGGGQLLLGRFCGSTYDNSLLPMASPMTKAPRNSTRKIPNSHCAIVAEACSTGEAEEAGDDGNDQKDDGPFQHWRLPAWRLRQ